MWLPGWFRRLVDTPTPAGLESTTAIAGTRPLNEQFQRIGGGLTPNQVSSIIRQADSGQPAQLVDLSNESRQKDGHLQGILGTRERAVPLLDMELLPPDDATPKEEDAVALCERMIDNFDDWFGFVKTLAGAFFHSHATDELFWEMVGADLIPVRYKKINPRDFIFTQDEGALRWAQSEGDLTGIDLAAEFPGRIVQIQRSVVEDVPAREGLARVLVWSALLRNWGLRDWLALGEVGWKPWRIAKYKKGTKPADVDRLIVMLENIGASGVGAIPEGTELDVEWPKGTQASSSTSNHRELFDTLGREESKVVLGQTTTTEPGPSGDRASTETRDAVRMDIREEDARATAAAIASQVLDIVVAVNLGDGVRAPVPVFQTEEAGDRKSFAEAVSILVAAGLPVPANWVRSEIMMPEPVEGEEVLAPSAAEVIEPDDERAAAAVRVKQAGDGESNEDEYVDRVERSISAEATKELAPTVAAMVAAVQSAGSYGEARQAMLERYRGLAPPRELASLTEAALTLAQASGKLGVNEETPELPQPDPATGEAPPDENA